MASEQETTPAPEPPSPKGASSDSTPGPRGAASDQEGTPGRDERAAKPRGVPLYRRKRVIIPLLVLLAVAALGVWYWYKFLRGYVSTDDAYLDSDRVSISPKVLGRISRLAVEEGARIRKGDLLVSLDETTLRSQIDQARANLALAEMSLPLAKVSLDRASDDFARADIQFKGSVITREQFDHARQALDAAKAEFGVARSRVDLARSQLAVYETMLTDMTLEAPIDGIIAKRWLLEGDVAQPGQPVFTLYRTDLIWVTANLEETKLGRLKIGDPVEVSVDTYRGRKFPGKVGLIYHYTASQFSLIPPNNASGNFTKVTQRVPIKIFLDELSPEERAAYPLRPGMSVEIKIRVR